MGELSQPDENTRVLRSFLIAMQVITKATTQLAFNTAGHISVVMRPLGHKLLIKA